jgi:hypothetical protein
VAADDGRGDGMSKPTPRFILSLTEHALTSKVTASTTLEWIMGGIKDGRWAEEVAELRAASAEHGKKSERALSLKKRLPAVLWTGMFDTRANDGLVWYSGLLCADVDDVQDRIDELKEIARSDPHAAACFASPSGTGLKVIFRVLADHSRHSDNFATVRGHLASRYGAAIDEQAKDLSRLCFVSHDPDAFWRQSPIPCALGNKFLGNSFLRNRNLRSRFLRDCSIYL